MVELLNNRQIRWILPGIIMLFLLRVQGSQLIGCQTDSKILSPGTSVQVNSDEFDTRILWQNQTLTSVPFHNLGVSNTSLLVSGNVTLYWQPIDTANCLSNPLILALDIRTGEEIWQFEVENFITQMFAVDGGFLIINPVRIILVDLNGERVWEKTVHNTELPLRSVRSISEEDNVIILSTDLSIFHIERQNGTVVKKTSLEGVVHYEDNRALVISGANQLQLLDINNKEVTYTLNLNSSLFQDVRINSLYPRVARYNDILFLYYETKGIEAYDYQTGELLWKIEKSIHSVPTLVNNLLAIYTTDNQIEFYNLADGELVGNVSINFAHAANQSSAYNGVDPLFLIRIASNENVLLVRDFIDAQLFAIELQNS